MQAFRCNQQVGLALTKKRACCVFAVVSALLMTGVGGIAVAEPIVADDWFPLVNGAVYDYAGAIKISSSTMRITVQTGATFAGVAATKVTYAFSCDLTRGKETWGLDSKSWGACRDRDAYIANTADGLREIGNVQRFAYYGFTGSSNGNGRVTRTSTYLTPPPPILKNGVVPGQYVVDPAQPNARPELLNGATWGGDPVSVSATYDSISNDPRTRTGNEVRLGVGVLNAFNAPAGVFRALFVDDRAVDVGEFYASSQLRLRAFHYAKGIGPIVVVDGDVAFLRGEQELGIPSSLGGSTIEQFNLVRHNLKGCPGFDASLTPLPANSGNICERIYGSAGSGSTKTMVEYYYPPFDYYFITSRDSDKVVLDVIPAWQKTGKSFTVLAAPGAGTAPINRFYFDKVAKAGQRGSHFYTLIDAERAALVALNPSNANIAAKPQNEDVDSYAYAPVVEGVNGSCATGLRPVYRVFRGNVRFPDDPNHRFTTDTTVYNDFKARGWDDDGVKMCVPM